MDFISSTITQYAEAHTSRESTLLGQINRETHVGVMRPRMLSGHLQGRFLSMVSHMIQPKKILEIGTYTGYSTLCLAEGLSPGGKVTTIEINEELEERVLNYFREAGKLGAIDVRIGDALKIIPTLTDLFELVWIDADKENYARYFDLIIDKVPSGGFILADNVLWSGKVVDSLKDKDTQAVALFNDKVQKDPRVENILLPVRDGIMMMRKI